MQPRIGLNLGSGDHAVLGGDGWLNVDRHHLPHWPQPPDILANVLTGLPVPDGRFHLVYLGHFLEHLHYEREIPLLWAELRRVCQPGAPLRVVGPCVHKAHAVGKDPAWVETWAYGCDDPSGLSHRWAPTTEATMAAVRQLDPDAVEVPVATVCPPDWPNIEPDGPWQVAVAATVP